MYPVRVKHTDTLKHNVMIIAKLVLVSLYWTLRHHLFLPSVALLSLLALPSQTPQSVLKVSFYDRCEANLFTSIISLVVSC